MQNQIIKDCTGFFYNREFLIISDSYGINSVAALIFSHVLFVGFNAIMVNEHFFIGGGLVTSAGHNSAIFVHRNKSLVVSHAVRVVEVIYSSRVDNIFYRTFKIRWRTIQKSFHDSARIVRLFLSARAEEMPVESKTSGVRFVGQNFVDDFNNIFAVLRKNKFVAVNEGNVAAQKPKAFQCVVVRGKLRRLAGEKCVRDKSRVNVRLQNFTLIVGAFVVVNEKVIHAD